MHLRKDILLFYLLVVISVGVIIAADQPVQQGVPKKAGVKCCKLPKATGTTMPLNTLAEGIFRINA